MSDYRGPGAPPQAGQPPQDTQPSDGQPPRDTQPWHGQPLPETQPWHGQPQRYLSAPYGHAQQAGHQPAYGPLGYGQPPYVDYQPARSGMRKMWMLGIGLSLLATVLILVIALVVKPGSKPPKPGSTAAASQPAAMPAGVISGKSGLTASSCPASGADPWKLVKPATVCGMPMSTDPTLNGLAQTDLQTAELIFSFPGNIGSYTSTIAFQAAYPDSNGPGPGPYEGIEVYGFNGKFPNPAAAVKAMVSLSSETFYNVPAGPHGGVMQCSQERDLDMQECVFATSTTMGDIQFSFQAFSIPAGISADASAISVRNAVEVQS